MGVKSRSEPTVSVVIPAFNRAHTITRALHSVFKQSHPAYEVIVVDDGSNDQTCQLVQEQFPSVQLIQQENRGVSAARNCGIRSASGEWIALLDSDDAWMPHKLSRQIDVLQEQPYHPLCHTNELWIRNGKRVNPMKKHEKKGGFIFQNCLNICSISPSSVVLHKNILDEVGYFDEALPVCEDYDLWIKICANYPVFYIDAPLTIKYGGHADQLSRKYWGMDRFRVKALDRLLRSGRVKGEDRQAACAILHEKCRILIKGAVKHRNQEVQKSCYHLMERHPLGTS